LILQKSEELIKLKGLIKLLMGWIDFIKDLIEAKSSLKVDLAKIERIK
jgi:hypothetical protein